MRRYFNELAVLELKSLCIVYHRFISCNLNPTEFWFIKWKLWYAAYFYCSHQCGRAKKKTWEWKKPWIKGLTFQSKDALKLVPEWEVGWKGQEERGGGGCMSVCLCLCACVCGRNIYCRENADPFKMELVGYELGFVTTVVPKHTYSI